MYLVGEADPFDGEVRQNCSVAVSQSLKLVLQLQSNLENPMFV